MLQSWMTLFLPKTFPKSEAVDNYLFFHNVTHSALVLDYGSIMNHHESANTQAIRYMDDENLHFQVRMEISCESAHMHTHMHNTCTFT